jgi:hypothetical protein
MAEQVYTPNPNYYQDLIKDTQKLLDKYQNIKYDIAKGGYVVDGKVLTQAKVDKEISNINKSIVQIKKEQKQNSKYGPQFGKGAKPNAAGVEYEKLVAKADAIDTSTFAGRLEKLQARRGKVLAYDEKEARPKDLNGQVLKQGGKKTKKRSYNKRKTQRKR